MKNYLNMGWFDNKLLYIDMSTMRFYTTNIKRNDSLYLFLSPVVSTGAYLLIGAIGNFFEITDKLSFRATIFVVTLAISVILGKLGVRFYWSKLDFTACSLSNDELETLISHSKKSNITALFLFIVISLGIGLVYISYISSGGAKELLLANIVTALLSSGLKEYSPRRKTRMLRELQKQL